jgi:Fe-S cluster assembly protein SufD
MMTVTAGLNQQTFSSPLERGASAFYFVNGRFSEKLSDTTVLPPQVVLSPLGANGIFLYIPENCVIPQLIHLVFLNMGQEQGMIAPRNIIVADKNSRMMIMEDYVGCHAERYFTNAVTQLQVRDHATVEYYKIQHESLAAAHVANLFVEQNKESQVRIFFLDTGTRLAREELKVNLSERGAECHVSGFYRLDEDGQHLDHQVEMNHLASHCSSTLLFKGVLDKKTRAVFHGKVHAAPAAQQTHARQASHHLLLSTAAEVNARPELEIYADDVQCLHGATVGQLDDDKLFYLRARGIEKKAAEELLTQAFFSEVLQEIHPDFIRNYIQQRAGQNGPL